MSTKNKCGAAIELTNKKFITAHDGYSIIKIFISISERHE